MPERIYELKDLAGRGGTSSVYFAVEKATKKKYIFKVPDCQITMPQIQKEAALQRKIHIGKVPSVYGCMQIDGKQGLLMEYKKGSTLEACLKENKGLSEMEVLRLGVDLCRLLIYMHTRNPPIYYLDLKPANILMKGKRLGALVDFGCAAQADHQGSVYSNGNGTHRYAAPEQFCVGMRLGPETDLYGLGKVLLEAVKTECITPETSELFRNCIRARMEDRPSSAAVLEQKLRKRYLQLMWKQKANKKWIKPGVGILAVLCITGAVTHGMRIQISNGQESTIQEEELNQITEADLKVIEELLQVLYGSDEISEDVSVKLIETLKVYLEHAQKELPQRQRTDELLKLLRAVELIKKGNMEYENER